MKNRIYCTFILSIITVMVCAQTEQPKDSIKGHRETVPEIRQGLQIGRASCRERVCQYV